MKETVRDGYDALGEAYAASRTGNPAMRTPRAAFRDTLPADARVLDAGCGPGDPVLAALNAESDAVGLDISRTQLDLAARNAPGAGLAQGGLGRLPFADDSFDGIVALWSLIHVPLGDHTDVLAEFARVLRPGGTLLVLEGRNRWQGSNPDWLDAGTEMQWAMAGAEATRAHCHRAGFTITDGWWVPETLDEPRRNPEAVRIPHPDRQPAEREQATDTDTDEQGDDASGDELASGDDADDVERPWTVFLARLERESDCE